ncbi:unnamed protein product [Caenorhabditis sp. 36 PRJEB53466]|nr:unnamed protein product [Caenorhabditis sp. 36 PRJEB53466]
MSLFGSSTTSTPLFGTTTSTAAKPLFGSTPATTTIAATAPKPGGLFGYTAPATSATVPLFGSMTTTTTSATPSLGGGLFGATSTAGTTSTTAFGSAATPATPSLGLGGVQQNKNVTDASGSTVNSLTGGDKDTSKDAELQAANFIREMLPLIEDKLKKNRDMMEEVENMPVDNLSVDEMIDKTRGWINEIRRNVGSATETSHYLAQFVSQDKALLETARRGQEQAATANQTAHAQSIKKHLADRTNVYDLEMRELQARVNHLMVRFEKLLKGEASLTMSELDEYFHRSDRMITGAKDQILELGREIEQIKNLLIEQGYTHLRRNYPTYSVNAHTANEGAVFFPSQSSLAIIGSSLRAPAAAVPATRTLGLGGGSSLFGSNTGGSSLFGTTTAPKPAFTGGSLFGNLSTTPATSTTTTAASTSLFGSRPATTFASTVNNNSSGTLFTSKK